MPRVNEFVVSLFAGGHPFWCVDEENLLRNWIDDGGPYRFGSPRSLPEVKTSTLNSSTTVLEVRWPAIDARCAWQAGMQVISMLEQSFPEVVCAPFLRVEATLQSEYNERNGRWTKEVRAPR